MYFLINSVSQSTPDV